MPDLVIDASVAVKWVSPDEVAADRAAWMLADYQRGTVSFLAPSLWGYEVASGVNKAVARGDLVEAEGREVIEAIWAFRVKDFPVVVTMDAHGNSLHAAVLAQSQERLKQLV